MAERLQSTKESLDATAAERLAAAEHRAAAAESALKNAYALRAAAQEIAEKAEARAAAAEEAARQLSQRGAAQTHKNGSAGSARDNDRADAAQYLSSVADAGAVIIDIGNKFLQKFGEKCCVPGYTILLLFTAKGDMSV
jgi:hypothetical protein